MLIQCKLIFTMEMNFSFLRVKKTGAKRFVPPKKFFPPSLQQMRSIHPQHQIIHVSTLQPSL